MNNVNDTKSRAEDVFDGKSSNLIGWAKELRHFIFDAMKEVDVVGSLREEEIEIEHPEREEFGDYSTSIALKTKKSSVDRVNPRVLASQIAERLCKNDKFLKTFENAKVEGPGFLNIRLKNECFISVLNRVTTTENEYGKGSWLRDKKIMVEFTDPNPFKEFHIGHLYSNTVGESISRLLESQGAEVWRVNYQGDVGLHVAKAVWGMIEKWKLETGNWKLDEVKKKLTELEAKSTGERAKFLGDAYAMGATAYEDNPKGKDEIVAINKKIYEQDPEIMLIYKEGKRWSLEYFDSIYDRLGTEFKRYYFESEAGKVGLELVRKHIGDIFEESKGAVVFVGEKYGLHTRVFINSLGLPTYEAKELGLAPTKYKDFAYDRSIIITGNEINEYFKVLLKALSLVNPELAIKTKHISHGMVRLPAGKMSSRKGNVLTGEWLLDESNKIISQKMSASDKGKEEQGNGLDKANTDNREIADMVAIGAVKYAFLRGSIGHDVEFDFDESMSFEGNSGPYLQYTYARTRSVIRKSQTTDSRLPMSFKFQPQSYQFNDEEMAVLRWVYRFPEVVAQASQSLSPNLVCTYLFELGQRFNGFYNKHSILGEGNSPATREFRLLLTEAVGQVIKNGLWVIGIGAPERM